MKKYGFYAAIVLILAVNGVVLAGVQFNRSGGRETGVELTERELGPGYADKENSGVTLHLNWQRVAEGEMEWFDRKKLEEAGFDCRSPVEAPDAELHYKKVLPRKTYAVLEYEGAAWEAWLAREQDRVMLMTSEVKTGKTTPKSLEAARKRFAWEQVAASRLFAVDVGNDPKKLRERYANGKRYIIVPVLVRLNFCGTCNEKGKPSEAGKLTGSIVKVLTDTVQVPCDKQGLLSTLQIRERHYLYSPYFEGRENETPRAPRYAVMLNYGKRFEPWVTAVRPLPKQGE
jgi:Domain of unknown function (DUF4824)